MPRRLLYAFRAFTTDLGPRLGSWRLSIVLMVVAGLYYAFLAIWAGSSPPHVVQNIAGLVPFWLVYLLLLVNTGVCLWRRLPALKKEIGREVTLTSREPDWEERTESGLEAGEIQKMLRGGGYRYISTAEDSASGIRRRWAALGTFLFHGAFFLLALGFLITLAMRQEAQVWVAVGEEFSGESEQFLSMSAPRILASRMPAPFFRVERILPEFWQDQFLFTTLEADLVFPSGRVARTRINRPLWMGWGTFLRLSGFGYTPRYELRDSRGQLLDSTFVKLNVFPPGQRDYFSPVDMPHRVYLKVYPDFFEVEGQPTSQSLNLVNPAVEVDVYRGRIALGGAVLPWGNAFGFEGLTLSFPEIRYWGEFTIVRDPGAPILFFGYLLGIAGLLLKLPGKRSEVEWRADRDGQPGVLRGWGKRPRGMEHLTMSGGHGSSSSDTGEGLSPSHDQLEETS